METYKIPHDATVNLFSPLALGPLALPNRIVMAPMTRSRAGDGDAPTDLAVAYYAQRATAGLIITEASQVSAQAKGRRWRKASSTSKERTT